MAQRMARDAENWETSETFFVRIHFFLSHFFLSIINSKSYWTSTLMLISHLPEGAFWLADAWYFVKDSWGWGAWGGGAVILLSEPSIFLFLPPTPRPSKYSSPFQAPLSLSHFFLSPVTDPQFWEREGGQIISTKTLSNIRVYLTLKACYDE